MHLNGTSLTHSLRHNSPAYTVPKDPAPRILLSVMYEDVIPLFEVILVIISPIATPPLGPAPFPFPACWPLLLPCSDPFRPCWEVLELPLPWELLSLEEVTEEEPKAVLLELSSTSPPFPTTACSPDPELVLPGWEAVPRYPAAAVRSLPLDRPGVPLPAGCETWSHKKKSESWKGKKRKEPALELSLQC
jgi:hypothetical protein